MELNSIALVKEQHVGLLPGLVFLVLLEMGPVIHHFRPQPIPLLIKDTDSCCILLQISKSVKGNL